MLSPKYVNANVYERRCNDTLNQVANDIYCRTEAPVARPIYAKISCPGNPSRLPCRLRRLRCRCFSPRPSSPSVPDPCPLRLRRLRLCLRGFSSIPVGFGGKIPASRFIRSTTGPVSNSQSERSCFPHGECLIGKIQSYQCSPITALKLRK